MKLREMTAKYEAEIHKTAPVVIDATFTSGQASEMVNSLVQDRTQRSSSSMFETMKATMRPESNATMPPTAALGCTPLPFSPDRTTAGDGSMSDQRGLDSQGPGMPVSVGALKGEATRRKGSVGARKPLFPPTSVTSMSSSVRQLEKSRETARANQAEAALDVALGENAKLSATVQALSEYLKTLGHPVEEAIA
jgi:hypothetical protein